MCSESAALICTEEKLNTYSISLPNRLESLNLSEKKNEQKLRKGIVFITIIDQRLFIDGSTKHNHRVRVYTIILI